MSTLLNESLEAFSQLSPRKLHRISRVHRAALGSAEWHLALCLLAAVKTMAYRTLGYSNITDYAERGLNLSGRKAGALLSAARAFQHLPILSEAFRSGQICWAKLRAFVGLATPGDERAWLEFAMNHRIDQILRRVAQSPKEWKRQQALKAALEGKPLVSEAEVKSFLAGDRAAATPAMGLSERTLPEGGFGTEGTTPGMPPGLEHDPVAGQCSGVGRVGAHDLGGESSTSRAVAGGPFAAGPRVIRLVAEFTPDQYALYERAESRVRAKLGKRATRARILTWMAERVLDAGDARCRAKHQVVVHTDATGDSAWYETGRGLLPVHPSVLEQARKTGPEPIDIRAMPSVDPRPSGVRAPEKTSDGKTVPVDDPRLSSVGTPGSTGDGKTVPLTERPPSSDGARESRTDGKVVPWGQPDPFADGAREATTCPKTLRSNAPLPSSSEGSTSEVQASPHPRRPIPNDILRRLFARAGHRCERCGESGVLLEVHHRKPVSEGGTNKLEDLSVRCQPCHGFEHKQDFAEKPHWAASRAASQRSQERRRNG